MGAKAPRFGRPAPGIVTPLIDAVNASAKIRGLIPGKQESPVDDHLTHVPCRLKEAVYERGDPLRGGTVPNLCFCILLLPPGPPHLGTKPAFFALLDIQRQGIEDSHDQGRLEFLVSIRRRGPGAVQKRLDRPFILT